MPKMTGWKGLAFPFRFENGKPATSQATIESDDYSHIDESIRQILGTRQLERPFSALVGLSGRLIFKNYSKELLPYYESIVREAIEVSEKRINVDKVEFIIDDTKETGEVRVRIYWTLLKYNIPHITDGSVMIGGGSSV